MDLQGKVCLVTGGTSGIGAATALTLARKGAHVAVAARRAVPETHAMAARFVEADVADPAACRRCVDQVVKDFGRLDVLVHSAGGPVLKRRLRHKSLDRSSTTLPRISCRTW